MAIACETCHLVRLEMVKALRLYMRYPLETLIGLAFLVAIFVAIAAGANLASGTGPAGFGTTSDGVVVGYLCWAIAVGATSSMGSELEEEARAGVLEPIFLSGYSMVKVLVARSVGSSIAGLPAVIVLVLLLGIVSGKHQVLDPAIVPPLLLLELCATGVGLMLASGALVFKRIRLLLVAMQVAVIFLIMLPASADGEWLRVLPISTQVQALRVTVHDGAPIGLGAMAIVVANAAVYFLAGAALLHAASRRVRRRGQLAHH